MRDGCCFGCSLVVGLAMAIAFWVAGKETWAIVALVLWGLLVVGGAVIHLRDRLRARSRTCEAVDADLGPLPPLLCAPIPRPGPFRGGYLDDSAYRNSLTPLLRYGIAVRGVVIHYHEEHPVDGPEVDYEYAWRDHEGRIHTKRGHDSYDPVHAGLAQGKGAIVLSLDAGLALGKIITVVYDRHRPERHLVYEALHLDEPASGELA